MTSQACNFLNMNSIIDQSKTVVYPILNIRNKKGSSKFIKLSRRF